MTLYEQITNEYENEKFPYTYSISKFADETIYHYAKQLGIEEDQVVDMLIRYMGLTKNIKKFLDDINEKFKIEAWI